MERDKITKDLMNLVHDISNATLSIYAGIENIEHKYSDNKDMMERLTRMKIKVDSIDRAIDRYYVEVKGENKPI